MEQKHVELLDDPNNNNIHILQDTSTNETLNKTEKNSLSSAINSNEDHYGVDSLTANDKPSPKSAIFSNQIEPRFSKELTSRPKQLNLNIQFSSDSTYPIPSSIRLHCDDDKSEDRRNAEKRVHLYERKRYPILRIKLSYFR